MWLRLGEGKRGGSRCSVPLDSRFVVLAHLDAVHEERARAPVAVLTTGQRGASERRGEKRRGEKRGGQCRRSRRRDLRAWRALDDAWVIEVARHGHERGGCIGSDDGAEDIEADVRVLPGGRDSRRPSAPSTTATTAALLPSGSRHQGEAAGVGNPSSPPRGATCESPPAGPRRAVAACSERRGHCEPAGGGKG